MKAVIEGLLFISGNEGITIDKIKEITNLESDKIKDILTELYNDYGSESRGIKLVYLGNHYKLTTKEEHKEYYQKLVNNGESNLLSQSALETLAIIAYNQPITRAEVDEMRGVSSSFMIRKLVAKGLIKEAGKSTLPGRPNLYKTTSEFLDYFGLATINDLPQIIENADDDNEKELFTSIYKEEKIEE